jgi:GTPase SAR1 family protein
MNESPLVTACRRIADCFEVNGAGRLVQRRVSLNLAGLGLTDEDLDGRFDPGMRGLPPLGLQDLVHLEFLDLTGNRLTRLPEGVSGFWRLRWLGLNFNALEALPEDLGAWAVLERLYLRRNRLTRLPEGVGQLPRLLELDLQGNQLTEVPGSFAELLERGGPKGKPGIDAVYVELEGNPGQVAEVAAKGRETLIAWLKELRKGTAQPQGKLLLVGEGRVGKSSLLRALQGQAHDANLSTTHGLKIESWPVGQTSDGNTVSLNCWDFSGQQQMRETHQLFFTAPALYLLVWDPDRSAKESERQLFEWLWLIHQCQRDGARARVLVVATHHHKRDRHRPDNEADLMKYFGPEGAGILAGFESIDSDDSHAKGRYGIDSIREWVLKEVEREAAFVQRVPLRWEKAVAALQGDHGASPALRWAAFEGLVRRLAGVADLDVRAFARTMHGLGRLVWFEGDAQLSDWVILHPDWLGKAVSYVFEKASSVGVDTDESTPLGQGLVTRKAMDLLWSNPGTVDEERKAESGYAKEYFTLFRRVMILSDLIQPLQRTGRRAEDVERYLVPVRLGGRPSTWDEGWNPRGVVTVRLRLLSRGWKEDGSDEALNPWIAQGVFWRLMVRLHPYARGRNRLFEAAHWKQGVRLEDPPYGQARLHMVEGDFYFEGSPHLRGLVTGALRVLLDEIDQRYRIRIRFEEELGCQPASTKEELRPRCVRELARRRYFRPDRLLERDDDGCIEPEFTCRDGDCRFRIDVLKTCLGESSGSLTREQSAEQLREIGERVASGVRLGMEPLAKRFDDLLHKQEKLLEQVRTQGAEAGAEGTLLQYEQLKDLLREVLRERDGDASLHGPCLFSIGPAEGYGFLTDLGPRVGTKVRLHLHCEHSLLPASWIQTEDGPLAGSFDIEWSQDWARRLSGATGGIAQLLAGGLTLVSAFGEDLPLIKPVLEALKSVPAALAKKPPGILRQLKGVPTDWNPRNPMEGQGVVLKELHGFLRQTLGNVPLDEAPGLGLCRVRDRTRGRHSWVHPRFAKDY